MLDTVARYKRQRIMVWSAFASIQSDNIISLYVGYSDRIKELTVTTDPCRFLAFYAFSVTVWMCVCVLCM